MTLETSILASLLDLRFRNRFFDAAEQQTKAKENVARRGEKVNRKPVIEVQDSESRDESHKTEPASKHINRKTKVTEL